ncbi:MAG: hypothetical protein LIO41_03680 [Ruminococcus sp.]|nr:hypothetical protein [Ruminococcus sp.]
MFDEMISIIIFVLIVLAIIPAYIADDKGYDHRVLWWLCGILMFPVTLVVALVMPDKISQSIIITQLNTTADKLQKIEQLLSERSGDPTDETNLSNTQPIQGEEEVGIVD